MIVVDLIIMSFYLLILNKWDEKHYEDTHHWYLQR